MAHAQIPAQIHIAGQGEHTARPHNTPFPHDDRAVVEGGLVPKQILQQLAGHGAVQGGSGLDHVVQQIFPLKDHEGPHLVLGHGGVGLHRLPDGGLHVVGGGGALAAEHAGQLPAAQPLQHPADLRLKQDDQGQDAPLHHPVQHPAGGGELQPVGRGDGHDQHQDALDDPAGAALPHDPQQLVDGNGQDGDVNQIEDPDGGDKRDLLLNKAHQRLQQRDPFLPAVIDGHSPAGPKPALWRQHVYLSYYTIFQTGWQHEFPVQE